MGSNQETIEPMIPVRTIAKAPVIKRALPVLAMLTCTLSAAAQTLVDRGVAQLNANRPAEARDFFQQSLSREGESVDALNGLGVALLRLNKLPRAQQVLERAMKLDPDHRSVVNNLAAARLRAGEALRAAQLVADFLADERRLIDYELFFTLKVCMQQVPQRSRRGPTWTGIQRAADHYEIKLNSSVAGMTLWGQEWVTMQQRLEFEQQNRQIELEMAGLELSLKAAQQELEAAVANMHHVLRTTSPHDPLQADTRSDALERVEIARRDVRIRSAEISERASQLRLVYWPPEVAIAPIRARTPPALPEDDFSPPDADEPATAGPATQPTAQPPASEIGPAPETAAAARARAGANLNLRYATAFAISDSVLVTSALVVRGASDVQLVTDDGRTIPAELIGMDEQLDLALLKVAAKSVSPVKLQADLDPPPDAVVRSFPRLDVRAPKVMDVPVRVTRDGHRLLLSADRSPRLSGGPLVASQTVIGCVLVEFGEYRLIHADAIRKLADRLDAPVGGDDVPGAPAVLLVSAMHPTK